VRLSVPARLSNGSVLQQGWRYFLEFEHAALGQSLVIRSFRFFYHTLMYQYSATTKEGMNTRCDTRQGAHRETSLFVRPYLGISGNVLILCQSTMIPDCQAFNLVCEALLCSIGQGWMEKANKMLIDQWPCNRM